jgi:hypothetical protein
MRKPLTVLGCFFIAYILGDAFLVLVISPSLIFIHFVIGVTRGVWRILRARLSGPPSPPAARQTART